MLVSALVEMLFLSKFIFMYLYLLFEAGQGTNLHPIGLRVAGPRKNVARSNRFQNRCPLLQGILLFDPVQAPPLRHAFELVSAAIPKADSRLRHQILDRA